MTSTTTTPSPGRPTSHNPAQRDLTHVLAELEAAPAGVVTVDALLERGVQRPAQALSGVTPWPKAEVAVALPPGGAVSDAGGIGVEVQAGGKVG